MITNTAKLSHVIVMVETMGRSIEFYRDVLGLHMLHQSESWTEFDVGSVRLALHSGGKPGVNATGSTEPHNDTAGTGSISFEVPDVNHLYNHLKSKGVQFSLKPTARRNEGILLAVAKDPDGFEICFTQRMN